MTPFEQKRAAKRFAETWRGKGYEKGESQPFWIELLRTVFGVDNPEHFIVFESPVELTHTNFIDARIPATEVLIEQKSLGIDLNAKQKQSDGAMLTPMEQAQRYILGLKRSEHPRFIVVSNFATFQIYDTEEQKTGILHLSDLPDEYYRLSFLTDTQSIHLKREMKLSLQAGDLVGELYDEILKLYKTPDAEFTLKSLNKLCVRLVFCLYAEDAGIFPIKNQFHDYLAKFAPEQLRTALLDLFHVLDTKQEERKYPTPELAAFPYVNGGLFSDEDIEIPLLDDKVKNLLLAKTSDDFDWSKISPTIFGAVFESTLNPVTRRHGGMHYTSIENIHKVIDPLFLNELKEEFQGIKDDKDLSNIKRLQGYVRFQHKLASLTFLDPACGSGNFLTESFLSLRRLENEVIKAIHGEGNTFLGEALSPVLMSINQFYGIEINDFAVSVARTALWIAESQMLRETEEIVEHDIDFLPLKTNASIIKENALLLDWNIVISKEKLNYIMGNPPFVGARYMNKEQKKELLDLFKGTKNAGNLDYVCGWYRIAADMMNGTQIRAALVSTNSITQGEQPAILWNYLYKKGIQINFAYKTFRWDSESNIKAHVHCVIIGFSYQDKQKKQSDEKKSSPLFDLFDENSLMKKVSHINPYLLDVPTGPIERRNKPLCNVPKTGMGNQPIDHGNYLFTKKEMEAFIRKEPASASYFKPWYGADEFINRRPRYCLWLGDCSPAVIRSMPECLKRVQAVRDFRLTRKRGSTLKLADKPTRFQTENMPCTSYIIIPRVSSEKRQYIPIGFLDMDNLSSDAVIIMPDASLYHFGILTSNVHMAWVRVVCGRLKSDYRYSTEIVYNNFPWPDITEEQKRKIERTAQGILDARNMFPDSSLADLYDDDVMPPELRKAHKQNNLAVMNLYGYVHNMLETTIVADLMKRYQKLVSSTKNKK